MTCYFHHNEKIYFEHQKLTTKNFIIPFIEKSLKINRKIKVVDIGCGFGGSIQPFMEIGCSVVGVDLDKERLLAAKGLLDVNQPKQNIKLLNIDITKENFQKEFSHNFDLIILKDTIEHVEKKHIFIGHILNIIKPNGKIFICFPPWHMPFGGHQQGCQSRILSRLPYFHLLPVFLYKLMLNIFNEDQDLISRLLRIKHDGISIDAFEKILDSNNLKIVEKELFLINPIYKYKFGLKVRKQFKIVRSVPILRDFFTTSIYYLVSK
ncbi:class I SAM-dependent methyltransferase [Patescibacteria group bacterium]|nr:class I SAM-dependent methyltransferase [Patescibacteria group bacterium]